MNYDFTQTKYHYPKIESLDLTKNRPKKSHPIKTNIDVKINEITIEEMESYCNKVSTAFRKVFNFAVGQKKEINIKAFVDANISDENLVDLLQVRENKNSFKRGISLARMFRDAFKIGKKSEVAFWISRGITGSIDIKDFIGINYSIVKDIGATLNSIKICDKIIKNFDNAWENINKFGKDIDYTLLKKRKRELKDLLKLNDKNNVKADDKNIEIIKELENIYKYTMAKQFKKFHINNIKENAVKMGLENVRIASDIVSFTGAYHICLILDFSTELADNVIDMYSNMQKSGNNEVAKNPNSLLKIFFDPKQSSINKRERIIKFSNLIANMYDNLDLYKDLENYKDIKESVLDIVDATGCSVSAFQKAESFQERKILIARELKNLFSYLI